MSSRISSRAAFILILIFATGCNQSRFGGLSFSSFSIGPSSVAPPQSALMSQLTGCVNPNMGTFGGDEGVSGNPVFFDSATLIPGNPTYTTNTIFWTSRENSPGQSVLLSGAFTAAPKNVGYNTFQNMGSGGQQVITNDGGGGSYIGPVASASTTSVTLADDPYWDWMGTNNPGDAILLVISGTGIGEYANLSTYSGRTINLASALPIAPDSSSYVIITQFEKYMTVSHNTLLNTLGGSIVLGDSFGSVIEDNVMTNSGFGILISAYGPYGGPAAYSPVVNTDVLRNTIIAGADTDIVENSATVNNAAGIGISDFNGCLISGLLIRNNSVASQNSIFTTDGWNWISSIFIEQNQSNFGIAFYPGLPGMSLLNNSGPPQ